MKTCTRCKIEKPLSDFSKKGRTTEELQPYCQECNKLYLRQHYQANKEYYKDKANRRNQEVRESNRNRLIEYLKAHPCMDCGEKDPVVLDFDHIKDKKENISNMIRKGICWDTILQEISKCEVRCANCHRRKTAAEYGWWKNNLRSSVVEI